MHFPYAAACDAHVDVECKASLCKGLVAVADGEVMKAVEKNRPQVIDPIPVWRRTATMFDHVFLIIWILVVLGLVLYLFYWNMVLGLLLSLLVRFLSWNQASASSWIEIGTHSTCGVPCSEGYRRLRITRVDTVFSSRRKNYLQGPTISYQQPNNPSGKRSNILEVLD